MKTYRMLALVLLAIIIAAIATPPGPQGRAAAARGIVIPSQPCPASTRDDLLTCLSNVDVNEDGTLTVAEMDAWIANNTACLPQSTSINMSGAIAVALCDADSSGNLTMTDWNDPNGCFQLRSHQLTLCWFCMKCQIYPPGPFR